MKDYKKLHYEKKNIPKSKRKFQIAVLGSSKAITTKVSYNMAFEVGEELAKAKCTTLTGGGLGVMEAALKGAKKHKGNTLAIIPWESLRHVNDYADVVVATGIGWSRNSINLNSCDGAIIVGGGAGTLNEATYGYMMSKPIVALTPSGGMAEQLTNKYFDVRKTEYIYGAKTPKEAVNLILTLVKTHQKEPEGISELDRHMMNIEEKHDWKVLVDRRKKRGKEIKVKN